MSGVGTAARSGGGVATQGVRRGAWGLRPWGVGAIRRRGGPAWGLQREMVVDLRRGAQGRSSMGSAVQRRSGVRRLFKRGRGSGAGAQPRRGVWRGVVGDLRHGVVGWWLRDHTLSRSRRGRVEEEEWKKKRKSEAAGKNENEK